MCAIPMDLLVPNPDKENHIYFTPGLILTCLSHLNKRTPIYRT